MTVLDKLLAASSNDPKCIEFELNDEETIEIYFTPTTLADLQKIQRHAKGDYNDMLLYTLIFKSKDENGEPLFTLKDKMKLKTSVSSDLLAKIVGAMGSGNDNDTFAEK